MKKIVLIFTALFFSAVLMAENKSSVMTSLVYNTNQLEELQTHSYGGTLIFNQLWADDETSINSKSLTLQASYLQDYLKADAVLPEKGMFFHQMGFTGMFHSGKYDALLFASASGNKPFSSMKGALIGGAYIYSLFQNETWTVNTGAGLFVTQIKIGSVTLPVIPLPVLQASFQSDIFSASLSFMGTPSLSFGLFNKSAVTFEAALQMAGFSSIKDLSGHASIRYYFLKKNESLSFLNFQVGVERTAENFLITNENTEVNSFGTANWGIYGAFNAALVTVKAGYLFDGIQKYDIKETGKTGEGWYLSVRGVIPL